MKKSIPARGRQSSGAEASQALPLLLVISILAIVFTAVFNAV
ncbi:MAG: hypothetical protein WBM13_06555 [Bacteroidia bacterium]